MKSQASEQKVSLAFHPPKISVVFPLDKLAVIGIYSAQPQAGKSSIWSISRQVEDRVSRATEGRRVGKEHPEHHILSGVRCPSCRGSYALVKFLGRKGDLYKVLVHCDTCDTYGVGTARIGEDNTSFAPPQIPAPITADDVLDVHRFLEDFDGDFRRLFGMGPVSKNLVE